MINIDNINVSYFENYNDYHAKTVSLASVLYKLQTKDAYPKVTLLHNILESWHYATWDEFEEFKKVMKKVVNPNCWTPSCVIKEGEQRKDSNIAVYNPLTSIDLDHKQQSAEKMAEFDCLKETLCKYPWVLYCGESLSGTGYFLLAYIDSTDPEKFKYYYQALVDIIEADGWVCDRATSSPSNFRFVSYDPQPYINFEAVPFHLDVEEMLAERKQKLANRDFPKCDKEIQDDFCKVQNIIRNNNIIIDDEKDWFEIGLSLADAFGESGRQLFHEISCTSSKYNERYTDNKFSWCLTHSFHVHTLGTFIHVLKKYGISCNDD